jgi:hypothetical protein
MSLITSASPWTNEESTITKKRVPSIRRTIKKQNITVDQEPEEYNTQNLTTLEPESNTMESTQEKQEERNKRISQMINKMTSVAADNDGNKLADFTPISNPIIQKRTDYENESLEDEPDEPVQINPALRYRQQAVGQPANYAQNPTNLGNFGNYQHVYSQSAVPNGRSMYAATPNNMIQQGFPDNKIMEKINYMIHMLEEQQNEKTNNVTEEFLLYTFLGVFIIFIVDSFARAGKYTR